MGCSSHWVPRARAAESDEAGGRVCGDTLCSRWRGMKNAFAMTVGTTALAITAATSTEYCDWSMIRCESPNSDEIVPKVSPVDISSVVYMPSLAGERNARVTG